MRQGFLSVRKVLVALSIIIGHMSFFSVSAQELQVRVNINHSQIQGTDVDIFDNLRQTIEQFINERHWTELQFQKNERIRCNLNITVDRYIREENRFECTALIQANRPTLYNNKDENFHFTFAQFDQLNFSDEQVDNQLTALLAYYAYLIIGLDLDSFAPMGGTDILQRCMYLVNNAQSLAFPGWKSFEDNRNRFAIINDYLDEAMRPFRQFQYDYYRKGLDEMANNAERGRTEISQALEDGLKTARSNKPLSMLPQIWTDYKRDELVNIYQGKGTQKEKERIYGLLMSINASQNGSWEKIKN